jgi:hypothetical protein
MTSGPGSISPHSGIAALDRAQPAGGRVLIREQLSLHQPSPLLLEYVRDDLTEDAGLPTPSNTNPDYLFLRQRIKEMAERHLTLLSQSTGNFAVFGCGEFNDVPVDDWLGRGVRIYGIDIVNTGIRRMQRHLRDRGGERLIEVKIDASLFASALLEELNPHFADLARTPLSKTSFPNKFMDLHRQALTTMPTRQLPFHPNSLDLAVSSLAINDFVNAYYNTVRILWEEFYLGHPIRTPEEADLFKRLMRKSKYSKLKKAAFKAHARELCRIVRSGGLAIIATHTLEFEAEQILRPGMGDVTSFRINPSKGRDFLTGEVPSIKLIDRSRPTASMIDEIDVRIGEEERRYTLSGRSLFEEVLAEQSGMRILDQCFFWMANPISRTLSLAKIAALRVN